MDTVKQITCNDADEFFNPVLIMGAQIFSILVLSHIFQLLLRPVPGPIAQILAGFVIGPSGLSNISRIKEFFFQNFAGDYYESMALYARIAIMFLIGLETDVQYLMRNLRRSTIVAGGGLVMCTIFAALITDFMYQETAAAGMMFVMFLILVVVLGNTGSPIVIRLAAHLKFDTSDLGRLAVCSALIGDLIVVCVLIIISKPSHHKQRFGAWIFWGFLALLLLMVVIVINIYLANMLNRRSKGQKYLKNKEVIIILVIVFMAATGLETMGFSSIFACFIIGAMFPRRGKACRTLLGKLSYTVHNFVFPVYFGYTGLKADITLIFNWWNMGLVFIIILVSIGAKISGTLIACHYLRVPLSEGVLIAFLLNLKGHVDLVTLTVGRQNKVLISDIFYNVMTVAVVLNSLISGPLIACLVRREKDTFGYRHKALEMQHPEDELRVLACVHGPRPVSTMISLIASARGCNNIPVTAYLMHLIELPERRKKSSLFHQPEEDEFSDEESYGGNDVAEINDAVDIFTVETGVVIHQVRTVAPFAKMYEDVCKFTEDIRASIILLPFHKHQRIDGKLETGKEGIRITNHKVLRHAQCSIGILVDRGHTASASSEASGSESLQHVAALFFGGPDDREALGFSRRLGTHHHINLTVVRFLPVAKAKVPNVEVNVDHKETDVLMAISDYDMDNEVDNAFMTDLHNRYVASGQVSYVEKHVENGEETAEALKEMADLYSLFIVGKAGRGNCPLTTGMSDWEECPELGTVGDLLASSEFDICGSVLVIQQHRPSDDDDQFLP